jgi:hypothetical protein
MEKISYMPLGIAFFVFIFLSVGVIPDWIKSMRKCKKCKKRFNKQYVSYQYGCGDYECRCGWEK